MQCLLIIATTAELSFYFFRPEESTSLNYNSEFNQTVAMKINAEDCFVNIGLYSVYGEGGDRRVFLFSILYVFLHDRTPRQMNVSHYEQIKFLFWKQGYAPM